MGSNRRTADFRETAPEKDNPRRSGGCRRPRFRAGPGVAGPENGRDWDPLKVRENMDANRFEAAG